MKKVIVIGMSSVVILLVTGQVLASETNQGTSQCGFFCRIEKIFHFGGNKNTKSDSSSTTSDSTDITVTPEVLVTPEVDVTGTTTDSKPNLQGRLDREIKNGKITQAQADEMIGQIEVIKTKQQELQALEKTLAEWMKTNNLPISLLGRPPKN